MPLFHVTRTYLTEGAEARKVFMQEHVSHMSKLQSDGILKLAGKWSDDTGAFLIVEAANKEEVHGFIEGDPHRKNGVYSWEAKEVNIIRGSI